MFFVLSKLLSILVMPLTIIFGCLLLSAFLKSTRWRRRTFWGGIALFFLFSNEFIANELMKKWEVAPVAYDDMRSYRLGVVLTGTMITQLKPNDRGYFGRGADRVVHTVQLYKLGLIDRILISGGSGRVVDIGEREADHFRKVMLVMGVPDSVIMVENQSRNTHESAVAVKSLLNEMRYLPDGCLLITSAFHMRRSRACFEKVGLPLDVFTTDFYAHPGAYYPDAFLIPKLEALILWHKLVREWVGMVAYRFAGYI